MFELDNIRQGLASLEFLKKCVDLTSEYFDNSIYIIVYKVLKYFKIEFYDNFHHSLQ